MVVQKWPDKKLKIKKIRDNMKSFGYNWSN
jgi:hypothetical protein